MQSIHFNQPSQHHEINLLGLPLRLESHGSWSCVKLVKEDGRSPMTAFLPPMPKEISFVRLPREDGISPDKGYQISKVLPD